MLRMSLRAYDMLQVFDFHGENGNFKQRDVYTYISHNITTRETPYRAYWVGIGKYIYMCKHIIYKEKPYRTMGYKLSRRCRFMSNVQTSKGETE